MIKKTGKFSGIKTKAIFYTIMPVIISFSVIFTILFVSLFNSQQETVVAKFQNIVKIHAVNFENKLNYAIDYLTLAAGILESQIQENKTDRESMQKLLFNVFDKSPDVDSSRVFFEPDMYDGNDSEYAGTQLGTARSGRICFYYYRADGKTLFLPEIIEEDIEFNQPYYIDVKTQNAPIYTDPTEFNINGKETIMVIIAYPLRGKNNEFIGAVTADIHLDDFYDALLAEKIYETGYIIITNDKGIILYSPKFEDIGKTRAAAGLNRAVPVRPSPGISAGSARGQAESEIIFVKSVINNAESLLSRNTIEIPELNSSFFFTVAAPLSEINANEIKLAFGVTASSVIVLILISVILYFMINNLSKPLGEFSKAAEKIAQGDYSIRMKDTYKDEFEVLKKTVNFMAERVEEHASDSRRSLRVLENILHGIDANIYVTVPETGELLFVNEQMLNIFNFKEEDCIGKKCYKVFRNLDERCDFCPCIELNKNPEKIIVWEEYVKELGRDIRHSDRYIDWPGGMKVHLQYAIDTTDIKLITAEKIKAESDTVELTREKNQAQETSRIKSVFLASMSHEIRTPMHGIIGFSELALDDNIPVKTRNYLSKIKTSAESLLMIINDILDVSKIEAGRMEMEKIPFDVSDVFKLCRIISSPKAREKGLTLFCYAEPSVDRMLLGDPTRLRQALLNLLSNAIKFTNNGIVKLLSAITEKTDNSITMHFEVKDSGIGMTEDQVKRAFMPFMQADGSTTRKYGGTGLGLTITKSLIEMMGGRLEVESNYGLGSRFSFNITFDTIDASSNVMQKLTGMYLDAKPVFDHEILVCEDNPLNQMVIRDHLSKVGIKSVIAANGKICIDYVKERIENGQKQFDLIFMDIHMPEMDGLEAAKTLIEMNCKIPVIALTANIMSNDRETYLASGMYECLPKPFVAHDLWTCLLKYLKPISMMAVNQELDNAEEEEQRMELITAFVKGNQSAIKEIKAAVDSGDLKLAHRLTHTLKGVAGIVGMNELMKAAQFVEYTLSLGRTESLNEQLPKLKTELIAALKELTPVMERYMSKVKNKYINEIPDRKKSLELLETLDSLLASDSYDSLNLVNDLCMIPESEQLVSLVENMRFGQARAALADLKEKIIKQTENSHE